MEAFIFSTCRTEYLEPEPRILGDPVMAFALEAAARAGAARTQTFGSSFTQVFAHPEPGAPEPDLPENGLVLVFAAPLPLIKPETLQKCLNIHREEENACTAVSDVYVFQASKLLETYRQIQRPPVFEGTIEREILRKMAADGQRVRQLAEEDGEQFLVVEDHARLALAARVMKERINAAHMANGVAIADPANTYIGKDVTIGAGTLIHPGTFLEGQTVIGERCVLGPNTRLANVTLADNVKAEFSVALDSTVGSGTTIGPFAYLRPNSAIGRNCKVGDFVEVKNSVIADGSKASHLTYIGDSDVGARVNFGCGTVTVNYDGANKARTVIEDDVFIGCNTNIIAPVTVGEGAYIAAGSTITNDVEAKAFAIARARQVNKTGWKRKGRL